MKRKTASNCRFKPPANELGALPWARVADPTPRRKARHSRPRYRAGLRSSARRPPAVPRLLGRPEKPDPVWHITDDLPDLVPVMRRELEVIETYLASLLDESLEEGKTKVAPTNTGKRGNKV
jgi:hypothetical protein